MILDGSVMRDRRRPGRREVDPALIPLLRGTATIPPPLPIGRASGAPEAPGPGLPDEMDNAGRGLVFGLLLSVPLWGLLFVGCWIVRVVLHLLA